MSDELLDNTYEGEFEDYHNVPTEEKREDPLGSYFRDIDLAEQLQNAMNLELAEMDAALAGHLVDAPDQFQAMESLCDPLTNIVLVDSQHLQEQHNESAAFISFHPPAVLNWGRTHVVLNVKPGRV
jgi:hypothetical protein